MVDVSKKKEDAKKEIRSLLLSAPVGLTLAELERDYCLFIGNKLPSTELGYTSTEEFLQDIPDTVEMTYKGATLLLKGVSDTTTKHIQKLVSNQRLDTRKNWGALKIPTPASSVPPTRHVDFGNRRHSLTYNDSSRGRGGNSFQNQDWRRQAGHPVMDLRYADPYLHSRSLKTDAPLLDGSHAEPHSHSSHRNVRIFPLLGDIKHGEPHSNSYHQNVRKEPPFVDNWRANPHSQSLNRKYRIVPPFIWSKIDNILNSYSGGIPLIHFPNIFRKHFGFTLDFWRLGFSNLFDFLASLEDLVVLKIFSPGETWVMRKKNMSEHSVYNGPVGNHRLVPEVIQKTGQVQLPRGRTIQTEKSLLDASQDTDISAAKETEEKRSHTPNSDVKANDLSTPYHISSTSYQDEAHNLSISHLNETHNSLSALLDKIQNSPISQLDEVHDSPISHLDEAHDSPTSHLDEAHDPPTSHLNEAHDSPTSHLDEVHDSPTSHLDEAHHSPTSHLNKSYSSADSHLDTSCNIPLVVQDHIRQIMVGRPKGLYASRLPFEYRNMFKEELPMKIFQYNSVVEFAGQLPHIIKIERPHPQGDWHLLPASVQASPEISVSSLTAEPGTKRTVASIHVDDSVKETVVQVLGMHDGLDDVERAYKVDDLPADDLPADAAGPSCSFTQQELPDFGKGPKSIELYVSNIISPEEFWFQLRGQGTTLALEDLMDELNDVYMSKHLSKIYNVTPGIVQQGLVCAAIYTEDNNWYRAVISDVKDQQVEIFYVDYGNTCCVAISDLRLLKTKFLKFPAQAIKARLSNMKPADGVWKVSSKNRFLALTRERPLYGFVTNIKDGVVSLCLTDTTQEEDVHINGVFVDEGYAMFTPDMDVEDVENSQVPGTELCVETSAVKGQDDVLTSVPDMVACRRYVRQAQMTDEITVNLVNLDGELHLLSSEVSSFFFDEDIISAQLSKDNIEIVKKVVMRKEHGDLFQELTLYGAANVSESTNVISLFQLTSLPQIVKLYDTRGMGEEVEEMVTEILQWFDPDDRYWQGEDDSSGSGSSTTDVDTCSSGTDSSDLLSITVLEQALSTLEAKRNRLLKRIIMENDCSSQSVDELADIEQRMTRVETGITKLQNNPAQAIDLKPLTLELKEQKSVTELKQSEPFAQIKSLQKVAPMVRDSLPQEEPQMRSMNMSAQTSDITSLLQEQILLNRLLMERLSLSQLFINIDLRSQHPQKLSNQLPPQLTAQGAGNHQLQQPLLQTGHQPQIGNLALNLLNPLLSLGTYQNNSLLQQNPWQFQGSTLLQPHRGLEQQQLSHQQQLNQLPTFSQPALNSGLTVLTPTPNNLTGLH